MALARSRLLFERARSRQDRHQLRVRPVLDHFDRIGTYTGIGIAHDSLHNRLRRDRRDFACHRDRFAADAGDCRRNKVRHKLFAQIFGNFQLLRDLHRLDLLLGRSASQTSA